jgi:hypothetical protein
LEQFPIKCWTTIHLIHSRLLLRRVRRNIHERRQSWFCPFDLFTFDEETEWELRSYEARTPLGCGVSRSPTEY